MLTILFFTVSEASFDKIASRVTSSMYSIVGGSQQSLGFGKYVLVHVFYCQKYGRFHPTLNHQAYRAHNPTRPDILSKECLSLPQA